MSVRWPIIFSGESPTFVELEDPVEVDLAKRAFATQWNYVHGRADTWDLLGLIFTRIDDRYVEADPNVLDEWARRGEFDMSEIYRELFG